MPRKLTDRQRKFCENLNRGMSATEAAREAGYDEKWAGTNAGKLLKNTKIAQYLDALRAASTDESIIDGKERRRILSEMARGNLLASIVTRDGVVQDTPSHSDRSKALELLAKMDGDLAPVKLEVTAKIQTKAQDWMERVLATIGRELGDDALQTILPYLPVLELDA